MKGKGGASVGEQPSDEPDSQDGDRHREYAADNGQEHALRKQLPNDTESAGTEAEPDCNLTASRGGPRQQETSDIGASNGENQTDQRHEYVERFGIVAPQRVDAAAAFLGKQSRQIDFLLLRSATLDELMELSCQGGLRLADTDPWAQPTNHLQPVLVLVR